MNNVDRRLETIAFLGSREVLSGGKLVVRVAGDDWAHRLSSLYTAELQELSTLEEHAYIPL